MSQHQTSLYIPEGDLNKAIIYGKDNSKNNSKNNSTPSDTISASSINLEKVTSISSDPSATRAEQISETNQVRGDPISL
jgi:hypothetical protein